MADELSQNDRRWIALRSKMNESYLKDAVGFLRKHKIDAILIKGWAIAREYPDPASRQWGDFDFCVPADRYEHCVRLFADAHLKGVAVDLHSELRHLDTVSWTDLFENSLLVKLDDVEIRILRPEDHLRVLCTHWLTDGGAHRDKLWDVFHLLENHRLTFDWDRCLNIVSATRRNWVVSTIAVARHFIGLDTRGFPFEAETERVPRWMLKALEREWASPTRLLPMHLKIRDPKEFWRQIKKRLPPNPIQTTVEFDGIFDDSPRFNYQMASVFQRLGPSFARIAHAIRRRD